MHARQVLLVLALEYITIVRTAVDHGRLHSSDVPIQLNDVYLMSTLESCMCVNIPGYPPRLFAGLGESLGARLQVIHNIHGNSRLTQYMSMAMYVMA